MDTKWNDAEDEAMQGLPLMAQVLYLRGLRRHMDYQTGIVGERRRISYQMLRETLTVERRRGSRIRNDENVTKKQIRVALEQLESVGLVEWVNTREKFGYLTMRLPLAVVDTDFLPDQAMPGSIRANEEGHEKGMRGRAREGHGENIVIMPVSGTYPQQGRAREGHGRKGIPPDLRKDRQTDTRARVEPESYPQLKNDGSQEQSDPDAVPKLGEAIAMLLEAGVRHSLATSTEHRTLLADLLKAGATRRILDESIRKAQMSKRGKPWSVFYLEPIVRERLHPSPPTADRPGGSHASHQLRRQSGADIIAQGCADALKDFSTEDE